ALVKLMLLANFQRAARHLMVAQTDQRDFTTTYSYNEVGQVVSSTQPDGSLRVLTPAQSIGLADEEPALVDPASALSELIDPEGRSASMLTGTFGELTQATDAAGLPIALERDTDGNEISTHLPSGSITDRIFDTRGNLISQVEQTLNGETTATYSAQFSLLTSLTRPDTGITSLDYDEEGNLTAVTTPEGRTIGTTFTPTGLIEAHTDALGTLERFVYDIHELPIQRTFGSGQASRSEEVSYTEEGYIDIGTDAASRQFDLDYDTMGRLTTATLPDGRQLSYGYDAAGHLTSLTPPGREAYEFDVNNVGLLGAERYPAVVDGGTNQTRYTYNLARQLTRVTRADSVAIDFAYDAAGRLTGVVQPEGTYSIEYSVATGLIASISSPDGVTQRHTFDDSLLTQVSWEGVVAGAIGYRYDAKGRMEAMDIAGQSFTYAYNQDDDLLQAGEQTYSYDVASGLLTGTTLGAISESYEYNEFSELVRHTVRADGITVYDARYSYDSLGRLTDLTSEIEGDTTTVAYQYDSAGRVSTVTEDGTLTATYSYDSNDNRLDQGGTYDAQDRLISQGGATYSYSAQGERVTKTENNQTTRYAYDANGTLIGATLANGEQIQYVLDGQRRRVAKRVNGVTSAGWLYGADTIHAVARIDGVNAVTQRYVYGSRDHVPDYVDASTGRYKVIADHLGSIRLIIDAANGVIIQRLDYDTWGHVLSDSNPGFQPFGFAGGLYDRDTALTQFGFREYDAQSAQWTRKDPTGFQGSPNNLYSYAASDPVNLIDPAGAEATSPRTLVARVQQINGRTRRGDGRGKIGRLQIDRGDGRGFQCVEVGDPVYLGDVLRTDGSTQASIRFLMGGRGNLDIHASAVITGMRGFEVLYSDSARDLNLSFFERLRFNARRKEQLDKVVRIRTAGGVIGRRDR
ncbi:MAG: RHS repeat-associated core domain-containing protein, partial [Pseudomonadota bacterium]